MLRGLLVGHAAVAALLAGGAAAQSGFTVVPAYEGLRDFARAIQKNPAEREKLHRQLVVDAHPDACSGPMGSFWHLPPRTSAGEALDVVRRIEEAGVRQLAESGLKRASAALPGAENTVLCIQAVALNSAMEYMRGVGGVSLGGRIKIFVHPTIAGFARVEYTAAHEYHHEVARRHLQPGWSWDPLEATIAEGKADAFASRLFPTLRPPHTDPLSTEEKQVVWTAFQRFLAKPSPAFRQDFMFGLGPGMPRWAGYRLGFEIVEAFLEGRSDLNPPAWTALPAREFLDAFSRRRIAAAADDPVSPRQF